MKKNKIFAAVLSAVFIATACFSGIAAESAEIVKVYPSDGTENVSVLADVTIEYTQNATEKSVRDSIAVSPGVGYRIEIVGNVVRLAFSRALEYNTEYRVSAGGKNICVFTTERNPITTLFWEDFDDEAAAIQRFEEYQAEPTHESNFSVANGELKLYGGTGWGWQHSKPIIKGGESWIDYETEYDYRIASWDVLAGAGVRGWNEETGVHHALLMRVGENQCCYAVNTTPLILSLSAANKQAPEDGSDGSAQGYSSVNESMLGGAPKATEARTYASLNEYYHMTASLVGTEYRARIDKNGELVGEAAAAVTTNGAAQRGSVGFTSYSSLLLYYDNILVTDKGFLFEPLNIKNNDGRVVLKFNAAIADDEYGNKITVSQNGEPVGADVVRTADDTLEVRLSNPENDATYDIAVSSDMRRESDLQTMSNDKNFSVHVYFDNRVESIALRNEYGEGMLKSDGRIKASATVLNNAETDIRSYILIAAVYDDKNCLFGVTSASASAAAKQACELETEDIRLPSDVGGYTACAYIWSGGAMQPICMSEDVLPVYDIYVAPNGNDMADGTIEFPLKSFEAAQEKVRGTDKSRYCAINVIFRDGVYERDSGISFTSADSGTESCTVTYKSYPNETASVSGAKYFDMSGFEVVEDTELLKRIPEEAHGQVLQLDMKKQNLADICKVERIYYMAPKTPVCDIVWDGLQCKIARWPNDGYAEVVECIDPGIKSYPGDHTIPDNPDDTGIVFRTDAPRAELWKDAGDAWLIGYWQYNWAMDSLRIAELDGDVIRTDMSPSYAARDGAPYYIYNLLEEIDSPGEWFIDNDTDMLYIYPPSPLNNDTSAEITFLSDCMITMDGASHISFERMTFEGGKGEALTVENGEDIEFAGCTFQNFGSDAIYFGMNVRDSGLLSCNIRDIGATAVYVNSGNRSKLIPMGVYVINCDISRFGRNEKVYEPGISVGGVGNRIAHNRIHDAPHAAVLFSGNDIMFEYNEIYDVVKESLDAGAIYACRDYLHNGFVIRYNYIHDIYGTEEPGHAGHVIGLYFDDMLGGMTAYGNILNRVNLGIVVGGGKNNKVYNNIVMNGVGRNPYWFWGDDRAVPGKWGEKTLSQVRANLKLVDYKSEAWMKKYPEAQKMVDNEALFGYPTDNKIYDNVVYNHGEAYLEGVFTEYSEFGNNFVTDEPIGFVDEESGDLRLSENSAVYEKLPDFKYIPFENMGLYEDNYRNKEGELR